MRNLFHPIRHRIVNLPTRRYLNRSYIVARPLVKLRQSNFPISSLTLLHNFSVYNKKSASLINEPLSKMSDLVTFTSKDPNTLSNWEDWSCHHIDVDFDIDFESQKFYGNVVLDLRPKTSNIDKIILDTK